jgi:hypothetical protein
VNTSVGKEIVLLFFCVGLCVGEKTNVLFVRWLPQLPLRAKARWQNKILFEALINFLSV